ncbi:MAG: hypothetical protein R3B82_16080 [Sandaracinaceae bacterium]
MRTCSPLFLALALVACDEPPPPMPVPTPPPEAQPAPVPAHPFVPPQMDLRPATGPITPALFVDLAPASGPPGRGGLTTDAPLISPDVLGVGPFAVDDDGAVFTNDSDLGEVLVQPDGDWSRARALVRTPANASGRREELLGLAMDATHVYVSSVVRAVDGEPSVFAIRAVPKGGGEARVLARGECPGGVVADVSVDDTHAYWVHTRRVDGVSTSTIQRAPKAGGPIETIVADLGGFYAYALVDGAVVYATGDRFRERIERVPASGGPAEVLHQADDLVGAIVGDANGIAFTVRDPDMSHVHVFELPPGGEAREVAVFAGFPSSLCRDAGRTYWAEFTSEELSAPMRVMTETDGAPREVAAGVPRGAHWTIARGRVYWGTDRGVASAALR